MRDGVRLQEIIVENLQNVEYGKIVVSSRNQTDWENLTADVTGIYGQNGSGKTTFVHAMKLLKQILSGNSLEKDTFQYITTGKREAKVTATVEMVRENRKYWVEYIVVLKKEQVDINDLAEKKITAVYVSSEELKVSAWQDNKWSAKHLLIKQSQDDARLFSPQHLLKEITGKQSDTLVNLMVAKKMARKQNASFFFSKDSLDIFQSSGSQEIQDVLSMLREYGQVYLYVIDTRGWGPINLNLGLPLYFRVVNEKKHHLSAGSILFRLDGPTLLPKESYPVLKEVFNLMNPVLGELIPHMQLELKSMGTQLLPDGKKGMAMEAMSIRSNSKVPFRYESEGIKKIVAILQMFIVAYANPSITLVIDELDAGIFEYLLGELLAIFAESGAGQLFFTSHNLRPLETLKSKNIVFTTVNPKKRYIRLKNIKRNNNLRSVYYNDIQLGGTEEVLYEKTNNAAIRFALKQMACLLVPEGEKREK